MISLLALDLDGTLLQPDKTIDPATSSALLHLQSLGLTIVLASARPPRSVLPFVKQLSLTTPQIHYNGALVWRFGLTPGPVQHTPLPADWITSLCTLARSISSDCLVSLECLDRWLTDRTDPRFLTETARIQPPDQILPFEALIHRDATKLMIQGEPEKMDAVLAAFKSWLPMPSLSNPSLTIYRTEPDLLQVISGLCSKGTALKYLADSMNIPRSAVMAVGDAENDLSMFAFAGISAAMGTAPDFVRQKATFTVPSSADHGVLHALKQANMIG